MPDSPRWALRAAAALAALGALLMPSLALSQGAQVFQNGNAIPNHIAKFVTQGRIADVGGLLGDGIGMGLAPFAVTDNDGLGFCSNTAVTTGAYNAFCFGHDSAGNALLKVTGGVFKFQVGDTVYNFPGPGNGNVNGPTPDPTSGNLALWNGGLLLKDGGPLYQPAGHDVRSFGAKTDGSDSTAALNACLVAAGPGGICYAGEGRYTLLGDITIPRNTTLSCGETFPDSSDYVVAGMATQPALMLAGTKTISAGGQSAQIKNCFILRNGMTFPAANSAAYTGTAVNDQGKDSFSVTDSMIVGFNTAIYSSGPRPYFRRLMLDGNGTTTAVLEMQNGGVDIGTLDDIKIQSLATDNHSGPDGINCTAVRRPGTGLRLNAFQYLGRILVQNFSQSQFEILQQAYGGNLWADDVGTYCGYIANKGVYFKETGYAFNTSISLNNMQDGIVFETSASSQVASYLPMVWLDRLGRDGIVMGRNTGTTFGMAATIGLLSTNAYAHNANFTGSMTGTNLAVSALASGVLAVGDFITGAGVATFTTITAGPTCTAAPCNFTISKSQTVASGAMSILGAVGRYPINFLDTTNLSHLTVDRAYLSASNGGAWPYIRSETSANLLGPNLNIFSLKTDLGVGQTAVAGFSAGPNADSMLNNISAGSGGCSGLGTGTCVIDPGSSHTRGSFTLSPAGTPGTSGVAVIFFTTGAPAGYWCTANVGAGSAFWPTTASGIQVAPGTGNAINLNWSAAGLVAGSTYKIYYNCRP